VHDVVVVDDEHLKHKERVARRVQRTTEHQLM
jgi:hypothetical protein